MKSIMFTTEGMKNLATQLLSFSDIDFMQDNIKLNEEIIQGLF